MTKPKEIHHLDGDPHNNDLSNLVIRRRGSTPLVVCEHQIVPQDCPYCELKRLRDENDRLRNAEANCRKTTADFENLGRRFHGVSLDFRRTGTQWPAPWRARVVATKNERDDWRVEAFGQTADEAIGSLLDAIARAEGH